jgi:hypothetical protein
LVAVILFALDAVAIGRRARFFGVAVATLSVAIAFDTLARFFGAVVATLFVAAAFGAVIFVFRFFADSSLT